MHTNIKNSADLTVQFSFEPTKPYSSLFVVLLFKPITNRFELLQPLAQLLDLCVTVSDLAHVMCNNFLVFPARPTTVSACPATVGAEKSLAKRVAHACHEFQGCHKSLLHAWKSRGVEKDKGIEIRTRRNRLGH